MARSVSATAAIRPTSTSIRSATYLTQFVGAPCYSTLLRARSPTITTSWSPDLAEKWDISADGKTVTFQLHGGVVFHDGTPLTAEDVIYSLDRIRKPPRGIVSPRKGLLGNIASHRGARSAHGGDPSDASRSPISCSWSAIRYNVICSEEGLPSRSMPRGRA